LPAGFVEPCLPTLARAVPDGAQWAHELKHDGYRMVCRRDGDHVRIFTRRAERMPVIAEAIASLPITSVTIDGEAVICDRGGRERFRRVAGGADAPRFARGLPVCLRRDRA
jgi:bifunctional non-homologous end joining protein LigD